MLRQIVEWVGPNNTRLLAVLLTGAVFGSLGLQVMFPGEDWLFAAQLGLIWLFFVGLALTLSSRLSADGRQRLWLALGPGLFLLGLGIVLPDYALMFGGAGMGWMVATQLVLRKRVRMEYQAAIRQLRTGDHDAALRIMDKLIEGEPDHAEHYRFRAEVYRLAGNLRRSIADYERIIKLDPDSGMGHAGLAEVYAQQKDYDRARENALVALERAPHEWMPAYNLGMIEDRLRNAASAVEHLERAVSMGLPHSRYRLLARLWLARNTYRQGQRDAAADHIAHLRKQASGVQDWHAILQSPQAAPLRQMLEKDVLLAERLLAEDADLSLLADS